MTVMGHQSFFETEKSPQTRMNTKKKGLTSFLSTLHGAGGRTRTGTVSLPVDFESTTSANSITPANAKHIIQYKSGKIKLYF